MNTIFCYVDIANLCQVIRYFPQLNQNVGKNTLISLSRRFQESLNGEKYLNEVESSLSTIEATFYYDFKIGRKIWKLYSYNRTRNEICM